MRDLEERCIRPGHWKIEGRDVTREGSEWVVRYFGMEVARRTTLHGCRVYIADIVSPMLEAYR